MKEPGNEVTFSQFGSNCQKYNITQHKELYILKITQMITEILFQFPLYLTIGLRRMYVFELGSVRSLLRMMRWLRPADNDAIPIPFTQAARNELPVLNYYQTMDEIQTERRAMIRNYCRKNAAESETIKGKRLGVDFLVDQQHQLLYCSTYKVSSTQLKQLIVKFSAGSWKQLEHYSDAEREQVLQTHFKFMFVRQPLERLLSAFIDKMYVARDPMYRRMWGRPILKRYRPNATAEAVENCDDITFEEFVRYVVDGGWDPHWAKYHRWCRVCAIDYDFIGRFENLQAELQYVFRWAPGVEEMPNFIKPYVSHNTTAKVISYYSQLPRPLLVRLVRFFRSDYEVFGYPYPGPIFEQLLKSLEM